MATPTIWWVRSDCRLHDNEALRSAAATVGPVIPVYVFDPRAYGEQGYGGADSFTFQKTGSHRARFLQESVRDLRESLREQGSDLIVRHNHPETVIPELADRVGADRVVMATYPAPEEMAVETEVKTALRAADVAVERVWTHTLYHLNDLPTDYRSISDTYTSFRKSVERESTVREPIETPEVDGGPIAEIDPGTVPSLEELDPNLEPPARDDRAVLSFEGGETAGIDRLDQYLWGEDRLREYKQTRNGMLGQGYSSKLSAWLNAGCLSPRQVEREVRRYEDERVSNDSTYWLLFELIWRDFFQFQVAKHGRSFFAPGGLQQRTDIEWRHDETAFDRWTRGETGIPFVDANMRELNRTGYMSNRGRQNAASFLVNHLRIDWRWGAAYFETQLVDYDPASNYGNWSYIAGVGNDSRDRYFNSSKQAKQYDSDAKYVTHWLPELAVLPPRYAHEPWTMSADEQTDYGVQLGSDYPEPIVDPSVPPEPYR
ncbi:DASH family cryptochrome [Halalkalirubrum salinum]|uniref:DASH family cryptochrome n=1 Tax=Halalkalirubrum salinum TaxID=2563889 RepID=UPI0010FB4373|nr:DASH family cryptochrome [Halalkalirubrum salinum]